MLGGLLRDKRYLDDAEYFSGFASVATAAKDIVSDVLGGTAGSILALLNLHRAVFDPESGNWPDFRRGAFTPGHKSFMYGWCAGPAGIGLARLAQFGSGTPEVREEIQAAVADATSGPRLAAAHLCCGQCGRIELLLEAAGRLADNTLRRAAVSKAIAVESQAKESRFYPLTGANRGRLFAPSFFHGISGIGYTFLRIANSQLPSVLSLS